MTSWASMGPGATPTARTPSGRWRRLGRLDQRTVSWAALVVLLLATGIFLFRETRATTLWFDEWSWALHRRGGGADALLDPHNQHLSLIPVAIYKLLFATAGLGDYRPYRALGIIGHLGCVALVF